MKKLIIALAALSMMGVSAFADNSALAAKPATATAATGFKAHKKVKRMAKKGHYKRGQYKRNLLKKKAKREAAQ